MDTITQVPKSPQPLRVGQVAESLARAYDGHAETVHAEQLDDVVETVFNALVKACQIAGMPDWAIPRNELRAQAVVAVAGAHPVQKFRAERFAISSLYDEVHLTLRAVGDAAPAEEQAAVRKQCRHIEELLTLRGLAYVALGAYRTRLTHPVTGDETSGGAQ